ncbi:MAG: hypothetical protein KF819_24720 [Labilithrix sp.]|nr:hypothetical protein [Labilithrix sp.]
MRPRFLGAFSRTTGVSLLAVTAALLASPSARAQDPSGPEPIPTLAPPPLPPPTAAPAQPSAPVASAPASASSCSANPCGGGCVCAARCCSKCGCRYEPKVSLSVVGLRGSLTQVSAGPVSETAASVSLAGAVDSYALDGTTHGAMSFALGGGGAGFEGALTGLIDIGYRVPVGEDHGPFGRIGFDGRLQGNDLLYFSLLELPRATVGWQYLAGRTVIEGGMRGGAVLAGFYNPGEEGRRKLNGFEWGGFLSSQFGYVRLDMSFMRIEAKKTLTGRPVHVGKASLCAAGKRFGACVDGMLFGGDADMRAAGVRLATSSVFGLTLGVTDW